LVCFQRFEGLKVGGFNGEEIEFWVAALVNDLREASCLTNDGHDASFVKCSVGLRYGLSDIEKIGEDFTISHEHLYKRS